MATQLDRFLKYTSGSEPVITINVIAAIGFGIVVMLLERTGVSLSETELMLMGSAFVIGATWLARRGVFSPVTHDAAVTEALHTPVPKEG